MKTGSGTLTLAAGNTYTGGTVLSAGILALGPGGSLASVLDSSNGVSLAAGTTFDISSGGNQTVQLVTGVSGSTVNLGSNTLTLGMAGAVYTSSFAGIIKGSGGLTIQGEAGIAGINTYTGITTVNKNSELDLNPGGSISSSSAVNLAATGATLRVSTSPSAIQDLTGVAGTTVNLDAGVAFTLGTANSTTFAGSIVNGNSGFIKQGSGTLTLTGISTFFGITKITAGSLFLGPGGYSSSGINLANSGTTFDISTAGNRTITDSDQLPALYGVTGTTVNLGANTLSLSQSGGQPGGVSTFAGTIQGTGGLIKSNTGALVLTGTNTYSGATAISQGTLQFDQEVSLYDGNSARWTSINISVAAGGILAVNVGGNGEFTSTDVTTLLVNLSSGTGGFASGASIAFDTTNDSGGTFTYSGTISDTHLGSNSLGLVKLGTGTLSLSGSETYSGSSVIQAGTLTIGPSGTISHSSGVTLNNNGASFDISQGSSQTIQDLSGAPLSIVNLGLNNLTAGSAASTTFAGIIQGNGTLIKQNKGTLTLSGSNTYSGGTILNGGELGLASSAAIGTSGTISFSGGALQFTSVNTTDYSSRFNSNPGQLYAFDTNGQSVTLAGNLTSGSLTKIGNGTLTLLGNNTFPNGIILSGGELGLGNLGAIGANGTIAFNGGALQFSASNTTDYSSRYSTAQGQLYSFDTNGQSVTLAGNFTGGSLTKLGSGILSVTGNNNFPGGVAINGGELALGSNTALGSSGVISFGGGTLQFSANNTTDYSSRFSTGYGQFYSFDTNGQSVTLSSNLTSIGSSGGQGPQFTKLGFGTLTLSGANTYRGGTSVLAGILQITGSITNTSFVIISSGSTLNLAIGTLSTPGTITNNGTLVLGNGVTLSSTGTFTNNGTLDLRKDPSFTLPANFVNNGTVLTANSSVVASDTPTIPQWGLFILAGLLVYLAAREKGRLAIKR